MERKKTLTSTNVEMTCISKKTSQSHIPENPVNTEIEFSIPYDKTNIFYQLSGGTSLKLNTINGEQPICLFWVRNMN